MVKWTFWKKEAKMLSEADQSEYKFPEEGPEEKVPEEAVTPRPPRVDEA